ncbi:MAG: hypothetical protein AABW86_00920 [Candidatus Micrarchaeota archaeon]
MDEKIGEYAFILGVVLSLIIGVFSAQVEAYQTLILGALAILGLIVGVLNITDKEIYNFLIATIALLAAASSVSALGSILGTEVGSMIIGFVGGLAAFVSPAAVVVALKGVYNMASK